MHNNNNNNYNWYQVVGANSSKDSKRKIASNLNWHHNNHNHKYKYANTNIDTNSKLYQQLLQEAKKYQHPSDFAAELNTDILDQLAFEIKPDELKTFNPNELIPTQSDLDNAIYQQEISGLSKEDWAKSVNLSEPIDVVFENGKYTINDGHHRYYASALLNIPIQAIVTIKDNPILTLGYSDYDDLIADIYTEANSTNSIEDEAKKYDTFENFEKDYEVLYHGGSEKIIGDKLSLGGRVIGEVTEENLGTGQDYGGIFFTPELDFAKTFTHHSTTGKGKIHTFVVKTQNLFDPENPLHAKLLENFVGQTYKNQDEKDVVFDYPMYDFMYPKMANGERVMDWATYDPFVLEALGFEGAKVIENYEAYGDNEHLYTTVLFTGGQKSHHWKVEDYQSLSEVYNDAKQSKQLNRTPIANTSHSNWYKFSQSK